MSSTPERRGAAPEAPHREPRWGRLYVAVAAMLVVETLAFWLLQRWAA
ncbi:MAG: hypothetical protein KF773_19345 [Deltaproteobacteria bacterium]|nr:hypothetical protein [Deltaproteobacteria bacterium]MCW5807434.1 hypothetical protein [Deltaproteobacteria bacterium]